MFDKLVSLMNLSFGKLILYYIGLLSFHTDRFIHSLLK